VAELNDLYKELCLSDDYINRLSLPKHSEEKNLIVAELGRDGKEKLLFPEAAQAWNALKSKALEDGIVFYAYSAYRSYAYQCELIKDRVKRGETFEQATKRLTPPGFSEHHSGRAVDIASPNFPHLVQEFDGSVEFRWLVENAGRFGFFLSYPEGNEAGIMYELWHWLFRG
jgi:D-alanyl-D-alanine carboxypeptidase